MHDELGAWRLHRVLWVGDRGFSSTENRTYLQRGGGHFLFGEKLRQGADNLEALSPRRALRARGGQPRGERDLARQGRHRVAVASLSVATSPRRVATSNVAARRSRAPRARTRRHRRTSAVTPDSKPRASCWPTPPSRATSPAQRGALVIDQKKVTAEARLDGKFLLSSSDDSLSASDMARLYKGLLEVEDSWREMKQTLELRPVHHRKEERIRAHVTLCFLGLMLMRVAERATGDTWRNLRRELERMHLGTFAGPAGTVTQRTETTPRQREILRRPRDRRATDRLRPRYTSPTQGRKRPRRHYTRPEPSHVTPDEQPGRTHSFIYNCRTRD